MEDAVKKYRRLPDLAHIHLDDILSTSLFSAYLLDYLPYTEYNLENKDVGDESHKTSPSACHCRCSGRFPDC
jgi:hypothetical protein